MIARIFIAIILSPFWLLLAILMTGLYAIGYIKGTENCVNFFKDSKPVKHSGIINEYDEFDIHAN